MRQHWKKSLFGVLAFLVYVHALIVFTTTPHSTLTAKLDGQPSVIVEALDPSLDVFIPAWKTEVARRFNNAIVLLVHGGEFVENEWVVGGSISPHHIMHIQDVVRQYQKLYPNRTMVVLACNTGHLKLGIPGVYYAHSSVWCIPDRGLTPSMFRAGLISRTLDGVEESRWQVESDIVGNIFEFTTD